MDTGHFPSLHPRYNVSQAGRALFFTRNGEIGEHITVDFFEIDSLKPWAMFSLR